MYRTGYSFNAAIGFVPEVVARLKELGEIVAPISDRSSTFGFIHWDKEARKAGLRPVFGVELAIVPELAGRKSIIDYWKFLAIKDIRSINDLIATATANDSETPMLTYKEALDARDVIRIAGERVRLEEITRKRDCYVGLSPATSKGLYTAVKKRGLRWIACDQNFYPRAEDQELYRIMLGRRAETRSYPSHILDREEWLQCVRYVATEDDITDAIRNRDKVLSTCTASLRTAEIFVPDKTKSLREMCIEGAAHLNCDLNNKVYAERLDRELNLIREKNFEDYFYIISDLINYAKRIMLVGPARGSSCGSLVCYLLGITTIDPIPYNLIFERFIDVNRLDLPDIDIDFSDQRRHEVFKYAEEKYGKEHVARLGTVMMFQPTSAMNQVGAALRIPKFKIAKMLEGLIVRSSGDARANNSLEDSLKETPGGKALIEEFPEAMIGARMEGHPSHAGQHAAGIVITKTPVIDIVAVDSRTGATMCDKYDAESYKLLKIDALGLTQLSIFERTLELIGEDDTSAGGFLDNIPLSDPAAFQILNQKRWSGIFQYSGTSLQNAAKMFESDNIEDIIAVTALARPGPLANGSTNEWIRRRRGDVPVTYVHELFEPHLRTSLGVTIYQEQIMELGRAVGDLSWEDVTALRKAMSKSLGKEFFDKYGEKWKPNAIKKGIPPHIVNKAWEDMCTMGSWCFNRSHAVAYGLISYQCCWLKAHYPLEFAAATLDAENNPMRALAYLRELKEDGIDYIPVDAEHSEARWKPIRKDNKAYLVGPLGAIKGIGPKSVDAILDSRKNGKPIPNGLAKKLKNATTEIDSLYPVSDRIKELHPSLSDVGIKSPVIDIKDVQPGIEGYVVIIGVATRIAPRDENDLAKVKKRGRELRGPSMCLNLFIRDDSDEIYVKVDRFDYERLARDIIERGKAGKVLYAVKGTVPPDFRMIKVHKILHLGEM